MFFKLCEVSVGLFSECNYKMKSNGSAIANCGMEKRWIRRGMSNNSAEQKMCCKYSPSCQMWCACKIQNPLYPIQ